VTAVDLAGTKLIIWRHGLTDWNAGERFQGQTDIPLNDRGLAQAQTAAGVLAGRKPDVIVSSDLLRASQTAAALSNVTGVTVTRDRRLRERAFGDWEGCTRAEIAERFPEVWQAWLHGEPLSGHGIESTEEIIKRSGEALSAAAESAPGGLIVAATHGGTSKLALTALLGWPDDVLSQICVLGNCHWMELHHYGSRGWRLMGHNLSA
jgi:broad specificity phosphatase PhoE